MVTIKLTAAEARAVYAAVERAVMVTPRRNRRRVPAWRRVLGKLDAETGTHTSKNSV